MKKCYFAYTWDDIKLSKFLSFLKDKIETNNNFQVKTNSVKNIHMQLENEKILTYYVNRNIKMIDNRRLSVIKFLKNYSKN